MGSSLQIRAAFGTSAIFGSVPLASSVVGVASRSGNVGILPHSNTNIEVAWITLREKQDALQSMEKDLSYSKG
jgi:hypothetical protein